MWVGWVVFVFVCGVGVGVWGGGSGSKEGMGERGCAVCCGTGGGAERAIGKAPRGSQATGSTRRAEHYEGNGVVFR